MQSTIVVGVDPGIVHTGVVVIDFDRQARTVVTASDVVLGLDPVAAREAIEDIVAPRSITTLDIFVEKYRPRTGVTTDVRMVEANATFAAAMPTATMQFNTGVTKIITKHTLEAFGLWSFAKATHHQDLRSAARIALLGMALDQQLNRLLYDYLTNHIDGRNWDVRHH